MMETVVQERDRLAIGVITLFPEMFNAVTCYGVTGKAYEHGLFDLQLWNPRDFTMDVHQTVDDRPYGGGPGMVMRAEPVMAAIVRARQALPAAKVIYLSPQGKRLAQQDVKDLSQQSSLILLTGRYEGIDERVIEQDIDEEWSIGDYVLSGGELPAMVLIDAMLRMLPGVLGHDQSAEQDSFVNGLLDYPHYTRPEVIENKVVPEVLLSGNHQAIRRWRLQQSLRRTLERRPDLLEGLELSEELQEILNEPDSN
jgi:tRNA (guanine37-N1)-methyltransferase